ncbi:hypothetical protein D3C81_1920710 [compost metagenome]
MQFLLFLSRGGHHPDFTQEHRDHGGDRQNDRRPEVLGLEELSPCVSGGVLSLDVATHHGNHGRTPDAEQRDDHGAVTGADKQAQG